MSAIGFEIRNNWRFFVCTPANKCHEMEAIIDRLEGVLKELVA